MRNKILSRFVFVISILLVGAVFIDVLATNRSQKPLPVTLQRLGPVPVRHDDSAPANPAAGVDAVQEQTGPIVITAVQMDVSRPLRDMLYVVSEPATTIREMGEPGETEQIGVVSERPQIQDPVLQSSFSGNAPSQVQPLAPGPVVNFDGVTNIDGVYPPDTNGDVGPNHYVQWVNLHFQIFDKSGASLYGPAAGNTLWSGFGGACQTQNAGDPIVLYDQLADRWVMSQFTSSNPYGECIAISTTGDPTGSYYRYFFQFSTTVFYDYPKLGVWPDGYYLTDNRFTSTFQGASAIVLERDKMLTGQTARALEYKTSTTYGSLLPADLDGSTLPPSGSPNFILESGTQGGAPALHEWKLHVDWTNTANSTFSGPTVISIANFNSLCSSSRSCVPQPGTSVKLDGLGDRLMHRLAYRNFGTYQTMVVSQSVNAASSGTQAGIRWYEIRDPNGTPTVYQQGTFAPDANHRWMSSVAMDHDGNIGVVYSVSNSSNIYPSIRYTGRLASDSLGQLPQGETTLISGSGSQTGSASRWGDYAMISLDPADDCTFWMTQEYMPSTGGAPWKTRIGAFKFASCTTPTASIVTQPVAAAAGNAIQIEWQTNSEVDIAAFNLYRSTTADGVGRTLIYNTPAQYPGELIGSSYQFSDTDVQPQLIYFYWLEVVGRDGSSEFMSPASASLANIRIFLPAVRR
jgi:hypothetical protein